jgi:hypothetical protein
MFAACHATGRVQWLRADSPEFKAGHWNLAICPVGGVRDTVLWRCLADRKWDALVLPDFDPQRDAAVEQSLALHLGMTKVSNDPFAMAFKTAARTTP